MTETPAVSVIIAAYNAAAYLDRALASARTQTLAEVEILIVDDASTDDTLQIARRHAEVDSRVTVFSQPVNAGPGAARNVGLVQARGEWIAMLDADDAFTPDRLAVLTRAARAGGVDMIADDLTVQVPGAPDRRLLFSERSPEPFRIETLEFIAANRGRRAQDRVLLGFLKPLIRREFLVNNGLRYHGLRLAEDYFLYLELLLHGAFWLAVPDSFYLYTIRQDSLTATFSPAELDAMAEVDRVILERFGLNGHRLEAAAVRRHRREVMRAAAWTRFVSAIRRRDGPESMRLLFSGRQALAGILVEGAAALPRVFERSLKPRRTLRAQDDNPPR